MEIRMQEVVMVGRVVGDPDTRPDGTYFRFKADKDQAPFRCVCEGTTAENLTKYCRDGDEFSLEGKLIWRKFKGCSFNMLLIEVRYISYGRKLRTLRQGGILG